MLAVPLNSKPKYVASNTLAGPLSWTCSEVLEGDLDRSIRALKQHIAGPLLAIGSAALVKDLIALDLIDELRLMIDPLLVGGGKDVAPDDGIFRPLRLTDAYITTTGAVVATYVFENVAEAS